MLEWYKLMFLYTQHIGIATTADSFLGVVLHLNSNESINKYLSAMPQFFLLQIWKIIIYSRLNTNTHP